MRKTWYMFALAAAQEDIIANPIAEDCPDVAETSKR